MLIKSLKQMIKGLLPKSVLKTRRDIKWWFRAIPYRIGMLFDPDKPLFCPCCGLRFNSFISGNFLEQRGIYDPGRYENTRQDVLCPYCQSLPRHRILASWLDGHKKILHSASVLYFAVSGCERTYIERNKIRYTSADLFREADLKIDIQHTGLPDNSYDLIVCNHVLEHVDDFRIALKEMYRILRPGGSFICSFPMDPKVELVDEDPSVRTEEERIHRFGQNDHKRVFGMDAEVFLIEAGFAVEKIRGEDCPDEILPVIGPGDYDMNLLFHCKK